MTEKAVHALAHSTLVQKIWLLRFVAIFIDSVLLFIPLWVLAIMWRIGIFSLLFLTLFSLTLLLYSVFLETISGTTFGKLLMAVRVVTIEGTTPSFHNAIVRNLSKVFGLVIIDFILGLALCTNPRQRYLDMVAGTTVVYLSDEDPLAQRYRIQHPETFYDVEGRTPVETRRCISCGHILSKSDDGKYVCFHCKLQHEP